MKTALGLSAAAVILAGCVSEPVVDRARAVPIADILTILAERPYECGNYRADSDSCAYLSSYRGSGARIFGTGQIALQATPPVTATFTLQMRDTGDALCANADTLTVNVPGSDADLNRVFGVAVKTMFDGIDTLCTQYFRAGPDSFTIVSTDGAGTELPDGRATVRFFAEPRALYVEGS